MSATESAEIHSPARIDTPPQIGVQASPRVVAAIIGVMKRITEIRKEGWNDDGKYSYVYYGDVLAKVQDALVAEELVISPREMNRTIVGKTLFIKYEFDAYHSSGQAILGISSHTGACRFEFRSGSTDDKSANKCLTSGMKYGLLALFKIPPEDHHSERFSDGDADGQGKNFDPERPPGTTTREEAPSRPRADDGWPGPRPGESAPPPGPEDEARTASSAEAPPSEAGEIDFREDCQRFSKKLKNARDIHEAEDFWEADSALIHRMPDPTYDYFRSMFKSQFGDFPPAV